MKDFIFVRGERIEILGRYYEETQIFEIYCPKYHYYVSAGKHEKRHMQNALQTLIKAIKRAQKKEALKPHDWA
jgi:hypothetical protein